MGEDPIRYEKILMEIRLDIITGKYPVGSFIMPVKKIMDEYGIGAETAYKIHRILETEGLVQYVPRKGSMVVPFDQEYWMELLHVDAMQRLETAVTTCRNAQLTKDQIAATIHSIYEKEEKKEETVNA